MMIRTRRSYAVSFSLYILVLVPILLFFIVRVFKYSPRQQPHSVIRRPQNVTHNATIEKALVVVSETLKDCLWIDKVDPTWTKYIYLVTEDSLKPSSDITLSVPANKGNEAMRYLSFIIDRYHNLPSIIAFRHGHDKSWHQQLDSATEVNHLNLTTIRERGYQNFRCTLRDGVHTTHDCPDDQKDHRLHGGKPYWEGVDSETKDTYADFWEAWFGGPRPEYLMSACCAQFVVTRESVLRRSRDKYMEYRQFLIDTELQDYHAGRIFEKTWHVVFGMPPVSCETEEECMCEVYTAPLGCGPVSDSS